MIKISSRSTMLGLTIVACLLPIACSDNSATDAPSVNQANLLITVTTEAGTPVPFAEVIITVRSPIDTAHAVDSIRTRTNAAGSHEVTWNAPIGGYFPIVIVVTPEASTGLSATTVRDSAEWVTPPAPRREFLIRVRP